MAAVNSNGNEINVKRTKYNGMQPEAYARRVAAQPEKEVSAEPVSVAESTFTDGKASISFSITDTESNRRLRNEMERVGARDFDENAGLGGVLYCIFHRVKVRVEEDRRPCFGNIALIAVFAVVLCLVAASYSEYNAAYSRIKTMESQIEEYKAEQKQLKMAIDERDNFSGDMEDYVINVLGMVKEESLTKQYVAVEALDLVNVKNSADGENATGGVLLSGFKSILSKVFFDKEY